jgi:hypothetical protein
MANSNEVQKLPKLEDLHHDMEAAFKNDQLNLLLNQKPPKSWIKSHPYVRIDSVDEDGNNVKINLPYLPVEKVEFLLTRIFQEWRAEIITYSQLFNSVSVHLRLHYKNPITGEWSYHDGVGAVDVQTAKGESAADLSKIVSGAVQKALPAAESYALKDAAEKLGELFGKNLSRKDTAVFSGAYSSEEAKTRWQKLPNGQKELNGTNIS